MIYLKGSGVPIGVAEDNAGILWINDHATNLFFRFDPKTSQITKYSTSLPTSRNDTTTLPYWNIFKDNKIWFNEHEGNAIAYFDTDNSTLVEYQIPTRGVLWGNTSNPLKFALDKEGLFGSPSGVRTSLVFYNPVKFQICLYG